MFNSEYSLIYWKFYYYKQGHGLEYKAYLLKTVRKVFIETAI